MEQFQSSLVQWYSKKKRNLPWRDTKDPYLIWLSEVILQQTRVEQGLAYYLKFKEAFPTVQSLAEARELEVLNLWQGLGYYSRARNLHKTAQFIVEDKKGAFPSSYDELVKLKGIGPYTAAAVSSFAFDEPKAVVDGNVFRVLSRLFAIETPIDSTQGKKEFQTLADELLEIKNPATYNQAIMEFGAIQCVPVNPDCENCPMDFMCEAKSKNLVKHLPKKIGKTKVTNKYFVFQIIQNEGKVLIERRNDSGIWKNMYQFPLIEFHNLDAKTVFLQSQDFEYSSAEIKHILSHQHLFCHFVIVKNEGDSIIPVGKWVNSSEYFEYPVPRVIEKFVEENHELIFNSSQ